MKAGNIVNAQQQYNQFQKVDKIGKTAEKPSIDPFLNAIDTYTPTPPPTVKGVADPAAIDRLWNETNHAIEAIRKLVASMLGKNDATGQGFWAVRAGGQFKLSEADRAQAQELISEDGFFGVKQTTARIMDFAKALVGEGASEKQIENMRAAVQKGFDEVAKMFGGFDNLPQVSKDTYDAIMKAFDEWLGVGVE